MWLFSRNDTIRDSGLLEGFTDWHCHLLPGVDDGVKEVAETLQILAIWEELGVKQVWLTPHIMEDIANEPAALSQRFEALKRDYKGSISLHLAAENMMDDLFNSRLDNANLLPLGSSATHLLVETSYFNPPFGMSSILDKVKQQGFFPVLAHPERYQYMDADDYKKYKQQGVLFQLNVPSLAGAYGKEVQKKAEMLLDKGYYDLCGTDTHNLRFVNTFINSKLSAKVIKAVKQLMEKEVI
ncbi:MAG: capsular biosynthesis protein [Prevotella sp.]|nr:capsular biosynthesis protein [Prevotella sp.]